MIVIRILGVIIKVDKSSSNINDNIINNDNMIISIIRSLKYG